MKYISIAIKAILAASLRGNAGVADAQPINRQPVMHPSLRPEHEGDASPDGRYCFNTVLRTVEGGPTTAQLLAMFNENVVEHTNGKVYAVKNGVSTVFPHGDELPDGLYQIAEFGDPNACVGLRLVYERDDIGQIVSSPASFDPIEIIGVDSDTGKIYGYYRGADTGEWGRKWTGWGTAFDGSLVSIPNPLGEPGVVAGVSPPDDKGWQFQLYGNFDHFHYALREEITGCSSAKLAGLDSWGGKWAPLQGTYCPARDGDLIKNFNWPSTVTELMTSASFPNKPREYVAYDCDARFGRFLNLWITTLSFSMQQETSRVCLTIALYSAYPPLAI